MEEVGVLMQGLCLEQMLEQGGPDEQPLTAMLKDIDEQIKENEKQMGDCVKDIMDFGCDLSGPNTTFVYPMDAIEHVTENSLLERTGTCEPDTEEVTRFLKHVVTVLENTPGCEEEVLEQLLRLAAREGIWLPFQSSPEDFVTQSVISVNTVMNNTSHGNEALWNDINLKLKKYFMDKLTQMTYGGLGAKVDLRRDRRLRYIRSLCCLCSHEEVWSKYRSMRCKHVEQCLSAVVKSCQRNKPFKTAVDLFRKSIDEIIPMMDDDYHLLSSAAFRDVTSVMQGIADIYLDKIGDDIVLMLDSLRDELVQPANRKDNGKKPNRERRDSNKQILKCSSESERLSQLRRYSGQLSKSMDSLVKKYGDAFAESRSAMANHLESVSALVQHIVIIERHVETLAQRLVWQAGGGNHSARGRRTLKSALKRSSDGVSENEKPQVRLSAQSILQHDYMSQAYGTAGDLIMEETSLEVVRKPEETCPKWDWQVSFYRFATEVAGCLEQHVIELVETALAQDLDYFRRKCIFNTVRFPDGSGTGEVDYSCSVLRGVCRIIQELESLSVLALMATDQSMLIIRNAFVSAVNKGFRRIHAEFNQISCQLATGKVKVASLYDVMSTAAYIRDTLRRYNTLFTDGETGKPIFSDLHGDYIELVECLQRQVTDHHCHVVSTKLFQDASSHHWKDIKEFYEDERCSFSIQMWHLHMAGLQYDLWSSCQPDLARTIFLNVLQESLVIFAHRYTHAKPSYRRTNQFRTDITSILLCSSEWLFFACDSIAQYLDPGVGDKPYYTIHNCCCCLLSALAVLTSPLDALYKVFKRGFNGRRSRGDEEHIKGHISVWLSWVRPGLINRQCESFNDVQTTIALYLQIKLLVSQPQPNLSLLLQSLLMKDYTLPILMLTHVATYIIDEAVDEFDDIMVVTRDVFADVVNILMHCREFPKVLCKLLLPVIERTNTWDLFDNRSILGKTHTIPPWIQAVFNCLAPYIERIVVCGLQLLLARQDEPCEMEPLLTSRSLPCGCDVNSVMADNVRIKKDVLAEALYTIIRQMVETINALPLSVVLLFKAIQNSATQQGIRTSHNCVAIKLLATSLRLSLLDPAYIESLLGAPVSEELLDTLTILAQCSYYVLTASSYGKKSGTPRVAGMFMKANMDWLMLQVQTISDHFSNERYDHFDVHPLEGNPMQYIEQQMKVLVSDISTTKSGADSLRRIYNLIYNNFEWLMTQLDIAPVLGSRETADNLSFAFDFSNKKPDSFNPMKAYSRIGDSSFDHKLIAEIDYDWPTLLQSDLGMSEVIFRSMLFQRHEMQDGAYLEDSEKKPVQVLRAQYEAVLTD